MEKPPLATLEHIAHAEAQRRRINRMMVAPARHPDSGEPLPNAPNRYAATRAAATEVRRRLMLRPLPALCPQAPHVTQELPEPWVRVLDLSLCGLTKAQVAQVLGIGKEQADYALRRCYKALGVHNIIAAGAAWRARAHAEGHTMNEDDERAARALTEGREDLPPQPLTPRESEAMSLLAAGVARRDLPVAMGCRPGTVHALLSDAYKKLGAHDQNSAVQRYLAGERGGIDQPPYDRPMAANTNAVPLARGSKAEGPGSMDQPPGRELPP